MAVTIISCILSAKELCYVKIKRIKYGAGQGIHSLVATSKQMLQNNEISYIYQGPNLTGLSKPHQGIMDGNGRRKHYLEDQVWAGG